MEAPLYNQEGASLGAAELPAKVFGVAMNQDVMHQALVTQLANARTVIAHAKGRGEVRGGGRKPWKQKGTGRARHASIRSPIWKGGGVIFGPTNERNFAKKLNKKSARKALCMALSSKTRDGALIVLDTLRFTEPKTRIAAGVMEKLLPHLAGYRNDKKKRDSVLFVTPVKDRVIERAAKNIAHIRISAASNLNIKAVLEAKYLVLVRQAIPIIQKTFTI